MNKEAKQNKKSAKKKRNQKDVLALCIQAIRDARKETEFIYGFITNDYPASPTTLEEGQKLITQRLVPRLSNFQMIERKLTDGKTNIQIGKHLVGGVPWRLREVREYLRFLEISSTTDIAIESPGALVDSIAGSVDYKMGLVDDIIKELKEVFGGEIWD